MEHRRIGNTLVVRVDRGEEIMEKLMEAVKAEGVKLGIVTGIGALSEVTAGVYNLDTKEYKANEFKGFFEIISLMGSITTKEGEPYAHIHISCGGEDGSAIGGHFNRGVVSVTGEIFIQILDGTVERKMNEEIGINLIHFVD